MREEPLFCSVQIGWEGGDAALPDLWVLVLVLTDAVEVLDVAGAAQQLHKVLVVGDDQQLEVPLAGAALDDSADSERQRPDEGRQQDRLFIKFLQSIWHASLALQSFCTLCRYQWIRDQHAWGSECVVFNGEILPYFQVTHSTSAWASDSMLSRSRLVVGSSRARMPQFRQKVSASARRMIRDANTWTHAEVNDWKTAAQCHVHVLKQNDYPAPSDQRCSDLSYLKRCLPSPWPPCSCRSCA